MTKRTLAIIGVASLFAALILMSPLSPRLAEARILSLGNWIFSGGNATVSSDTRLLRSAAKTWKFDDAAGGAATMQSVGSGLSTCTYCIDGPAGVAFGSGYATLTTGSVGRMTIGDDGAYMVAATPTIYAYGSGDATIHATLAKSGLGLRPNTTPIASASTIAPDRAIVVVSGTAAINTITRTAALTSAAGGILILIPTGNWTMGTSGNVGAAFSATTNIPVICVDDGSKFWCK